MPYKSKAQSSYLHSQRPGVARKFDQEIKQEKYKAKKPNPFKPYK